GRVNGMDIEAPASAVISDRDLVLQFESIGDNCELGLVQRRAGAEPLGLLRFAGVPVRNLLVALDNRFRNLADPDHVRIVPENGEYMVKLTKYDFNYHAHVKVGETDPKLLHQQQCRTVRFLADKLISDLENPSKILVFRQNEPLSATDLVDLRVALAAYGSGVLLWVQQACEGHPPGTVVVVDDRFMVGFVRRLADRSNVPGLDVGSWMTVLRKAYALWQGGMPRSGQGDGAGGRSTVVIFGQEGNAQPAQGYGWSGPEPGYTWSVGERSLLILPTPGEADEYWLEMDVTPFVLPPLLPRQRLDVIVGGTVVHSFDPVVRGVVTCAIPGALVAGQDQIEIVLNHPHAASPLLVSGQGDDRRLGVAFRRVSLSCT
ncbi:MAG TPA: hypothetical protein PLD10_13915, partial [Rhodopila sp.]|nr:hypothetical protein [Rhodopila sp.]